MPSTGLRCWSTCESGTGSPSPVRTRVAEVVDLMLLTPVVTTRLVADRLAVTPQAALNYINELAERGWLQQLPTRGRGGRIYWLAAEVFAVLEAPAAGT